MNIIGYILNMSILENNILEKDEKYVVNNINFY